MITWVVFDLGDVVLRRSTALPRLAALLSAGQGDVGFDSAYWRHRRDYDLRSDAQAFWTAIAASTGAPPPDAALVAELVRVDDAGWSHTDPDVVSLIDELTDAGTPLAVLSNAPSSMGRLIEAAGWATPFRHLVFSGDVKLLKPEPEIYAHLLGVLGAAPGDVAFLDDRVENVEGARACGLAALHFTGPAEARLELRELGLPL